MTDANIEIAAQASVVEWRGVVLAAVAACTSDGSGALRVDDVFAATFAELEFDSLAFMEFCIAIHVETGVVLNTGAVMAMGSPGAVASYLAQQAE